MLPAVSSRAADPAPDSTPAKPAQAAEPALEQIVVTAKRRREDLQNVPQTVDVVSGAALQRFNLFQFGDVQQAVAGLQLNDNGGRGQNISLRGVTYDPDTTANPAVDVYVNEVPVSQTSSIFQDLYDIDALQVIRGPQGTLRGRTSPAGAILIDTKLPDLDRVSGYVEQSFSDDALFRTEGAVSAPLVPGQLAIRLAGLFDQNDFYKTRDVVSGAHDYNLQHSGRVTVEWRPSAVFDLVVTHGELNDRTTQLFAVAGRGAEGTIDPEENIAVSPGPYTFYDRTSLTTVQAVLHLDGNDLHYTGGYQAVKDEFVRYADVGGLLRGFDTGSQMSDQPVEQLTQEVRVQSAGTRMIDYMGGLYYAHQDANVGIFTPSEIVFQPNPGGPYPGAIPILNINANVVIPQLETDYAIFTDEILHLTDIDTLEGGLRWQFEKQYRASAYTVIIPVLGEQGAQLISPSNQHEEYRAWTGLASYTHRFDRNVSIYATYGQSFRPGGVVLGVTLPLPESLLVFQPETSYDFEIGTKTKWMNGRLRINADIFHQTYSGYIGREDNLFTTLGYASITTNGNAISSGAEMALSALITDSWQFALDTTYADSHYDNARLPCNDFAGTGAPNTDGAPRVVGAGITSTCVTNGTLGAPNWYLSFNTEYSAPLGGAVEGFVRALYSFTPRNRLLLQATDQDPRSIANLYIGARGSANGWEVYGFIRNLFNVRGATDLFGEQYDSGFLTTAAPVNFDTGYRSVQIVRPREIGVTLACHF